MVALVVHNQMLAALTNAPTANFTAQTDRDTVEPQVQMLREFVAHNASTGAASPPRRRRRGR